jgi:hypothetical protein
MRTHPSTHVENYMNPLFSFSVCRARGVDVRMGSITCAHVCVWVCLCVVRVCCARQCFVFVLIGCAIGRRRCVACRAYLDHHSILKGSYDTI